jgi:hypothetical protein
MNTMISPSRGGERPMGKLDFAVEFSDVAANLSSRLRTKIEDQLRELAAGHTDMVGAAIAVEELMDDGA